WKVCGNEKSLKAWASRNSDVAFGLETTPHGVCSYHEISEATSRSPYRISRFPEFLRLRKCRLPFDVCGLTIRLIVFRVIYIVLQLSKYLEKYLYVSPLNFQY
ncbi:hypothetical protein ALC56_06578, partial [Trachymyrmex septentrionalis]